MINMYSHHIKVHQCLKKFLKEHPEIKKPLNQLAGKITDEQMQEMNYKVTVKKEDPYKVAKAYLKKKGLLNNQVEIPGIELSGILFINRLNVIDFKLLHCI